MFFTEMKHGPAFPDAIVWKSRMDCLHASWLLLVLNSSALILFSLCFEVFHLPSWPRSIAPPFLASYIAPPFLASKHCTSLLGLEVVTSQLRVVVLHLSSYSLEALDVPDITVMVDWA